MSSLIYRNRRNPAETGVLNFMAGTNGFTMMDMVSYDQKHNEANGENNRDGSDYNYSWNCGVEGPQEEGSGAAGKTAAQCHAYALFEPGNAGTSGGR